MIGNPQTARANSGETRIPVTEKLSEGQAREESTLGPGSTGIRAGNVAMQLGYGLLLSRNHPLHQVTD